MLAENKILALHFLYFPKILAVKIIVYYCRSVIRERPLFVSLPLVPNAARILSLTYKMGKGVYVIGLLVYIRLHLLQSAPPFRRLSLIIQSGHKLDGTDT